MNPDEVHDRPNTSSPHGDCHAPPRRHTAQHRRPVTPARPAARHVRFRSPRGQAPGPELLDLDERLQLQRLEGRPRQPGGMGRVRLRLVHGLLQHVARQPVRLPVPDRLRPPRLRLPQLQGRRHVLRQQGPSGLRPVRGPQAGVCGLLRGHADLVQRHGLDVLPRGRHLRRRPGGRGRRQNGPVRLTCPLPGGPGRSARGPGFPLLPEPLPAGPSPRPTRRRAVSSGATAHAVAGRGR